MVLMNEPDLALLIERPSESVPQKVVRVIREAIVDGRLPAGRRLTERELMELTGVSRTSIREAVRHLQNLGLVESSPSRGVRVAVLSSADVQHIYEVRDALEPAAAELFVLRASDAEVAELVRYVKAPGSPPESPEERRKSIYHFDELMIKGARNPLLAEILAPLHARIHALRRLSVTIPGRQAASDQEYAELAAAIVARDAPRAAEASHRHIRAAAKAALEATRKLENE
jgi:GntR family transcriptional regulator, trigonelline degradation regulator